MASATFIHCHVATPHKYPRTYIDKVELSVAVAVIFCLPWLWLLVFLLWRLPFVEVLRTAAPLGLQINSGVVVVPWLLLWLLLFLLGGHRSRWCALQPSEIAEAGRCRCFWPISRMNTYKRFLFCVRYITVSVNPIFTMGRKRRSMCDPARNRPLFYGEQRSRTVIRTVTVQKLFCCSCDYIWCSMDDISMKVVIFRILSGRYVRSLTKSSMRGAGLVGTADGINKQPI